MGITNVDTILNINLGIAICSGAAAVTGASFMDRFGRRKILISVCATLAAIWALMTACTGVYFRDNETNTEAAGAAVAFIFLIGIVFSFGYTPLQAMYPVETLSYEQRAKGMAFQNIAGNAAGLVNMFVIPVALKEISWHTYIVFLVTCALETVFCELPKNPPKREASLRSTFTDSIQITSSWSRQRATRWKR